jgi:FkbM family methyltransferase
MNAAMIPQPRRTAEPAEVERAEFSFYLNYLRDGMTVFDVGAHHGELSLLLARFAGPSGRVLAFEPTPASFRRLSQLIQLTGNTTIQPFCLAVGDKSSLRTLHIYDDAHATWNTFAERKLGEFGRTLDPVAEESVVTTTLDQFCAAHHIERIDLLKVDVEGAELQVLRGSLQLLRRHAIACCVFEFGQTTWDMGNRPDEIESLLKSCGYRLQSIVPSDPLFPGGEARATSRYAMHIARVFG